MCLAHIDDEAFTRRTSYFLPFRGTTLGAGRMKWFGIKSCSKHLSKGSHKKIEKCSTPLWHSIILIGSIGDLYSGSWESLHTWLAFSLSAINQDFGHSLVIPKKSSTVPFLEWMPATPIDLHLGATINTISRLFIHQDLKPTLRVSLWDDKADKGIHNFHPFFEGVRFLKIKETSKWCHYSLLKNICDLDFCH